MEINLAREIVRTALSNFRSNPLGAGQQQQALVPVYSCTQRLLEPLFRTRRLPGRWIQFAVHPLKFSQFTSFHPLDSNVYRSPECAANYCIPLTLARTLTRSCLGRSEYPSWIATLCPSEYAQLSRPTSAAVRRWSRTLGLTYKNVKLEMGKASAPGGFVNEAASLSHPGASTAVHAAVMLAAVACTNFPAAFCTLAWVI